MLAMVAAAVALKVAVVAPAATVTEAGTVSEALLLASVTLEPPAGSGLGQGDRAGADRALPETGGIAGHDWRPAPAPAD